MNFKKYHVSKNLFDVSTTIEGTFVRAGNTSESNPLGSETLNNSWNCSNYIAVLPNTTYTVHYPNYTESISAGLVYFSDMSVSGAISGVPTTTQEADTFTFATPNNCNYIRFSWQNLQGNSVMLNAGSQPLPYEPYGSSWADIPHYIMGTSTDTITTLPADIYANDTTATVGLKGNMEQSGTPTPTTPIQPSETGERTGNLFDTYDIIGQVPSVTNGALVNYTGGATTNLIPIDNPTVTLTLFLTSNTYLFLYDENKTYIGNANRSTGDIVSTSITGYENAKYVRIRSDNYSAYQSEPYVTLVEGSTAPSSYIPYGIKIPILSGGTTTPVYLGEVQSTRRIGKLVLDGNTSINDYAGGASKVGFVTQGTGILGNRTLGKCTHFQTQSTGVGSTIDGVTFGINNSIIYFTFSAASVATYNLSDVASIKQYLADQYAAGTPVTVWYVLATPTTGIVNEPIRKIGAYADEISGITIPVTAGANILSVDTTLQPSEVSVNYHGWHPVADVHERDNGAWT